MLQVCIENLWNKKSPLKNPACKDNLLFVRVATCQNISVWIRWRVDVLLSAGLLVSGLMDPSPKMFITMAQDVIPKGSYNYTVVKVDGATPKRWLSKGP